MRFSPLLLASLAAIAIASPTPKDSASLDIQSPEEFEVSSDAANRTSNLLRRGGELLMKISDIDAEDDKDDEDDDVEKRSPADDQHELNPRLKFQKCNKKPPFVEVGDLTPKSSFDTIDYNSLRGPVTFWFAGYKFCKRASEGFVLKGKQKLESFVRYRNDEWSYQHESADRVVLSNGELGILNCMCLCHNNLDVANIIAVKIKNNSKKEFRVANNWCTMAFSELLYPANKCIKNEKGVDVIGSGHVWVSYYIFLV
jgi:hypothetical protein